MYGISWTFQIETEFLIFANGSAAYVIIDLRQMRCFVGCVCFGFRLSKISGQLVRFSAIERTIRCHDTVRRDIDVQFAWISLIVENAFHYRDYSIPGWTTSAKNSIQLMRQAISWLVLYIPTLCTLRENVYIFIVSNTY